MKFLRGAAALTIAAVAAASPTIGSAQAGGWSNPDVFALRQEVSELAREVAAMRGSAYQGPTPRAAAAGAAAGTPSGDFFLRLSRLEQALKNLTGLVERLDRATRDASKRSEAKLAELEFRLARLEGGAAGPYTGGPIPGTDPATEDGAGVGRLQPLQPENAGAAAAGAGAGAGVLGSIQQGERGGAVSRPLYDTPQTAGSAPGARGGAGVSTAEGAVVSAAPVTLKQALNSVQAGDHDEAERLLRTFIAQNDGDRRVGVAAYWLAETFRVRGMFDEAVQTYKFGLSKFPNSQRAPHSWLRMGMSYAQLNEKDKACTAFAAVSARFPDAESVVRQTKTQSRRAGCR